MQMVLQVQCMGIKRGGGHKAGRGDDSTWQTTRHKCNKKRETVHMQMRGTGENCGFGGRMKGCSVQLGHKESLRNALGALFSFSAARWVGVHARRATMLRPAGDSPVPGERYQHLPVPVQGITAKCKYGGGGGLDGLDWAGTIKGHCGAELVIIKL